MEAKQQVDTIVKGGVVVNGQAMQRADLAIANGVITAMGAVENTHMAFDPRFFAAHPEVVQALSDALWLRQTSPEQHRYHYDARRTWDTLGNAPKLTVPTLILCGADDNVNRGGSTPVGTARRLAELVPGSQLALVPNVKHMTFWDSDGALQMLQDFLARHPIRLAS